MTNSPSLSQTRSPWAAIAVLALGLFMTLLDITIVNVGIPSIVTGLHAGLDQVLWVINAYSLLFTVLLITSARLGDIYGPRRLFMAGLAVFTAASAASGLAQTPEQLIAARAVQGLGAALASPQGMPIMLALFPRDRRGGVFAIYGSVAGMAVLLGPVLGGFLVSQFGWRWIFFVNIPVGIATVVLAARLVPDVRPGLRHRLDVAGVGMLTAALLLLVFGLIEGERYDWGAIAGGVTIPEVIGAGIAVLIAFLLVQARRQGREPLLAFALFRDRNFALMSLVMAAMGFAMVGFFLPLTIFLQSVRGLSAVQAGLLVAPQPLAMMACSGAAAALVARVPGKYLLAGGLTAFAAGMAWVVLSIDGASPLWHLVPGMILAGAGLGFVWTPVFGMATADLKPALGGIASGVINTIQELGGVMASALIGAVLQARLASALVDQATRRAGEVPAQYRDAFVEGFRSAARHGLQVGAGETGAAIPGPLARLGHEVFAAAFVDASRASLLVPVVAVALAVGLALAARGGIVSEPAAVEPAVEPAA